MDSSAPRHFSPLLALVLLLAGCGNAPESAGAGRAAPASVETMPGGSVPGESEGCIALRSLLHGSQSIGVFWSYEEDIARLSNVVAHFDESLAQDYPKATEDPQTEADYIFIEQTFSSIDDATFDACGTPILTALDTIAAWDQVPEQGLPCFGRSGESDVYWPRHYITIDCATDAEVRWSERDGDWAIRGLGVDLLETIGTDDACLQASTAAALGQRSPMGRGETVVAISACAVQGLDPATLAPIWETRCPDARWNAYTQPERVDITLVECGDQMVSLNSATGEIRWFTTMPFEPSRIRVSDQILALQSDEEGLEVWDLEAGDRIHDEAAYRHLSIDVDATWVFVGAAPDAVGFDATWRPTVEAVEAHEVRPGWRVAIDAFSMFADAGEVIVRDLTGRLTRLDAATGEALGSSPQRHPELLDKAEIRYSTDDVLVAIATELRHVSVFDRHSLELLWSTEGPNIGHVAIGDGALAATKVGDFGLEVRDLRTGVLIEEHPEALPLRITIHDGALYYVGINDDASDTVILRSPLP